MIRRRRAAAALISLCAAAGYALGAGAAAWADDASPAPVEVSCEAYAVAGPITEPTVTSQCSDGSYEIANPDGSYERHGADGCVATTDADGNTTSVDANGNAVDGCPGATGGEYTYECEQVTDETGETTEVCPLPLSECIGEECALAYSSMGEREDCEFCRSLTGSAKGLGAPVALDSSAVERAAAAVDKGGSGLDQSAALELAGAGANAQVNLAAANAATSSSAPIAPLAAAVAGTGLIAAGVGVWRRLATRGL